MKKIIVIVVLFCLLAIPLKNTHAAYLAHSVEVNQSYHTISDLYGISLQKLMEINNTVPEEASLYAGQAVRLDMSRPVKVFVNSQELNTDSPMLIINSRLLIPIRSLLNSLGIDNVYWNQNNLTAYAQTNESLMEFAVGSNHIIYDKKQYYTDVPITLYQGRVYLPARAIAEMLSMEVSWDSLTSTVNISKDNTSLYWLSRIVEAEAV